MTNLKERYTNAFRGYGLKDSQFVIELTYNYGVDEYDIGTGFGHFGITVDDANCGFSQGYALLAGSSSMKYSHSSDASRPRKKPNLLDNSDEDHSSSLDKGSSLQGVPWKHFSRSGFSVRNVNSSWGPKPEECVYLSSNQTTMSQFARASTSLRDGC
ncbi:hypothetical protein LOK49_LG07G00212 [Camellia lanceoleosa]|uniref:Uncharacterized protein n=1 Tax=Camellia lanceoleosa TaxID=1840588 RepID=A0ACC0GZX2_9ERIC|nr:hypothetical protein LOK49_LG07G00212 [Camellia lanceoleosa]